MEALGNTRHSPLEERDAADPYLLFSLFLFIASVVVMSAQENVSRQSEKDSRADGKREEMKNRRVSNPNRRN